MNPLDIVIALLCLASAVLGLVHGFVRQAVSWAGLVAGHLLGVRYHAAAARLLSLDFRYSAEVGYLCVFAAAYLAVRLLGALVERWVRGSKLSGADRLAGGAAGLLKGALLSILLVFFLVIFLPRDAALISKSKLSPRAVAAGRFFGRLFPDRIAGAFREKLAAVAVQGASQGQAAPRPSGRPREQRIRAK